MDLALNMSNIITIAVYLISFAVLFSKVMTSIKYIEEKIDRLEKKQDKHNGLIERMVVVEQSTKSSHHRLDELEHRLDKENL